VCESSLYQDFFILKIKRLSRWF